MEQQNQESAESNWLYMLADYALTLIFLALIPGIFLYFLFFFGDILSDISISTLTGYSNYAFNSNAHPITKFFGCLHDSDIIIFILCIVIFAWCMLYHSNSDDDRNDSDKTFVSSFIEYIKILLAITFFAIFWLLTFYKIAFGINYLTAKSAGSSYALIEETRRVHHRKAPDEYYLRVRHQTKPPLDYNTFRVTKEIYKTCETSGNLKLKEIEWKKGCFGFFFIDKINDAEIGQKQRIPIERKQRISNDWNTDKNSITQTK